MEALPRAYEGGPAERVLFWRVFLLNAAVLVAAGALPLRGPITVSAPVVPTEALSLAGGMALMLGANAFLLRLGLAPLQRVTGAMTTIDLLSPQPRPEVAGEGEVAALIETFNSMLDRLEAERATSGPRVPNAAGSRSPRSRRSPGAASTRDPPDRVPRRAGRQGPVRGGAAPRCDVG